MSRCRCSPTDLTGCVCAFDDSDCVNVSGTGEEDDPFVANFILDPDPNNILVCSVDGLGIQDIPQANPPRVRVVKTVDQSLDDDERVQITWDSADYDVTGWFNISEPNVITVPDDGLYTIRFDLFVLTSGITRGADFLVRTGYLVVDGATVLTVYGGPQSFILRSLSPDDTADFPFHFSRPTTLELKQGQKVGVEIYTHTDFEDDPYTADTELVLTDQVTYLSARWVSPLS